MKVYLVVWAETYEDSGVLGIYLTREAAEERAATENEREAVESKGRLSRCWYEVEEWTTGD